MEEVKALPWESDRIKELRDCFGRLNSNSVQIDFLNQHTEAGLTISNLALGGAWGGPHLFKEFVLLLGELEIQLTQGDPMYERYGLQKTKLDLKSKKSEDTILFYAVGFGLPDHVEILLQEGADSEIRNNCGYNVEEWAQKLKDMFEDITPEMKEVLEVIQKHKKGNE